MSEMNSPLFEAVLSRETNEISLVVHRMPESWRGASLMGRDKWFESPDGGSTIFSMHHPELYDYSRKLGETFQARVWIYLPGTDFRRDREVSKVRGLHPSRVAVFFREAFVLLDAFCREAVQTAPWPVIYSWEILNLGKTVRLCISHDPEAEGV
jgi:hypothetical protein